MYNCSTYFMLNYLKNTEIDKKRWDMLVSQSSNATIFCFSWYLDAFCSWNAIIFGDYEGAIALPIKKQVPFNVIYQPPFVQKCDWFGAKINEEKISKLLKKRTDYIHFNTNINFDKRGLKRINLILPLKNYETICEVYSKSLKKNIRKAKNANLKIKVNETAIDEVIDLYTAAYGSLNNQITALHYNYLRKLVLQQKHTSHFKITRVYHNDELIASLLFGIANKRIHYLLGAPNEKGRKLNALSFAIDSVIQEHASNQFIFDFEGSSIPNVRAFFESFGSTNEGFYEVKISPNRIFGGIKYIYSKLRKS